MEGWNAVGVGGFISDGLVSSGSTTIASMEVVLSPNDEAKRQCVLAIADQLKRWSQLNPTAREKFEIAQITSAFGWNPEIYVDMGFDHEGDEDGTQGE